MPDVDLLKQRNAILMSFFSIAPIALAPIGGSIATFGLNLPFLVSAGCGLLGWVFAMRHLREVKDIRSGMQKKRDDAEAEDDEEGDAPAEAPAEAQAPAEEPKGAKDNPWKVR